MADKNTKFDGLTASKDIPVDAFMTEPVGVVCMAAGSDGRKEGDVSLSMYDGGIHSHWYWGNLAFDLKGMKLAKSKIPILYAHDTDIPVGISTTHSFDGKFVLDGKFLSTSEKAKEIQGHSKDGFEYESSLRFDMSKGVIEYVKDGESVEVNGLRLKGPGTVMRKAVIMEGSICVFGALGGCRTEAFEIINQETKLKERDIMSDKKETLTLDGFKTDHSDLFEQVFGKGKAEGEKAERDAFAKTVALCDGDNDLAVKCFTDVLSDVDTLQAKNAKLAEELAEVKKNPPAKPGKKVDAADMEFSDNADELADKGKKKGDETDEPKTFMEAVKAHVEAEKCSEADAVDFCATKYPELHAKMRG